MKKFLLTFLLLAELSVLFAGSPVMVVRCRQLAVSPPTAFADCDGSNPNFVTYMGQCFPIPVDGECPAVPGFDYLVPRDIVIDKSTTITICVPDCSDLASPSCSSCVGPTEWNIASQSCSCDDGGTTGGSGGPEADVFCGCPEPLEINPNTTSIVDGTGTCVIPERVCFDLGLAVAVAAIDCNSPTLADDVVSITLKPAPGTRPGDIFAADDVVTIEELNNCILLDDSQQLLDLVGTFGDADRGAFIPDANGCIVIEFTRDPSLPTTISFLANDPIFIEPCLMEVVPTLGEWAIITLGLLMMIFSVVAVSHTTQLKAAK